MGRRVKSANQKGYAIKPKAVTVEDLNTYEPDIDLRNENDPFWKVKTVPEMINLLETNKNIKLDAKVMGVFNGKPVSGVPYNRESFLEAARSPLAKYINYRSSGFESSFSTFREDNGFADDVVPSGYSFANAGLVGDDFVPLLGGPFNKQQYIYDYLQATSQAFFAFHHDPIARMIVTLMRDFSLGRSFRVDAKGDDAEAAQALWQATEKVNDLPTLMNQGALEVGINGELMVWELPDSWSKIEYKLKTGEDSPRAWLPRFRLIDPTVIWDIITYPEDITRVLAYQWVAPTQYQIYTKDKKTGISVPSMKFIYQQIPASQVDHYKVNVVSDEKRGRGDLYPILGYLKRLRDTVNYKVIGSQKNAAWSIDTEIDGSPEDMQNYYNSQLALGTFPPAGSEFIHSAKVKRTYLSNQGAGSHTDSAWDWCANMIACPTIPISYWGINSQHGSSRATSMVATEPVVKRFEMRRQLFEQIIKRMFDRTMNRFGLKATCEVTFPELVVQDRSAKLADLQLAQDEMWFSPERCATMASKEFDVTEFDYQKEKQQIEAQSAMQPTQTAPLTTPGEIDQAQERPDGNEPKNEPAPASGGKNVKSMSHTKGLDSSGKRSLRLGRGA